MYVVINELSFLGQAENNYDEADNLMTAVFEIIEEFVCMLKFFFIFFFSKCSRKIFFQTNFD